MKCPSCNAPCDANASYCVACGTKLEGKNTGGLVGHRIGAWTVTELVARGGVGDIYLGERPAPGWGVAKAVLKVPRVRNLPLAAQRRLLQGVRQEGQILSLLKHPHIVPIEEVVDLNGCPVICMKYIYGEDLSSIIHKGQRKDEKEIPWQVALKYLSGILDALHYAHTHQVLQVIHGDIKPANIRIEQPADRAWLLDFNLSSLIGSEEANVGLGTVPYAAPEVIAGEKPTAASDIYSMAVTAYELLTAEQAFPSGNRFDSKERLAFLREHKPIPLGVLRPDLPRGVVEAIHNSFALDPSLRSRTAREFREELLKYSESLIGTGPKETWMGQAVRQPAPPGESSRAAGHATTAVADERTEAVEHALFKFISNPKSAKAAHALDSHGVSDMDALAVVQRVALETDIWLWERAVAPYREVWLPVLERFGTSVTAQEREAARSRLGIPRLLARHFERERECGEVQFGGVWFVEIPGGVYRVGTDSGRSEQSPEHEVLLRGYWISKDPVTQDVFGRFLAGTMHVGDWLGPGPLPGDPKAPVHGVSWRDAVAFCDWFSAFVGRPARLPTEAQWEVAARGRSRGKFPWGDAPPDPERAVFGRSSIAPLPVGGRPKGVSPFGVRDLAGNVWEWCRDWYDSQAYWESPRRDPKGPKDGHCKVLRGGSFASDPCSLQCTARSRDGIDVALEMYGFRIVVEKLGGAS